MIEICEPAIELLIQQRLASGKFASVDEVLLQALTDAPLPDGKEYARSNGASGAEIVSLFERSPHKEIDICPEGVVLPISDPVRF